MKFRVVTALLAICLLAGCPFSYDKDGKKKAKGRFQPEDPLKPTKDESGDVAFQAFVGRLRSAVEARDMAQIASMMTPDFGYRWDNPPAGANVFAYWDQNDLWPKLTKLMGEKWVPYDGYMVVPPELASNPQYGGYRAGVKMVNGSWRFAYFVSAPPPEPEPATPAPTSL